jgi:hypothetical protein
LGLAQDLAELSLPQVIVMREPVPDQVAQEFLKYFLSNFADGKSLYLAVREARGRLQGIEDHFPCATWLPIIYQNPAEVPPTWQELSGALPPLPIPVRDFPASLYPREQVVRLSCLAQRMSQESQTIFSIKRIQQSWLPTSARKWLYGLGVVLVSALASGLAQTVGSLPEIMLDTIPTGKIAESESTPELPASKPVEQPDETNSKERAEPQSAPKQNPSSLEAQESTLTATEQDPSSLEAQASTLTDSASD